MATYLIGNVKGPKGEDGYSPKASVQQTSTGAIISIQDADGLTTAEIRNGIDADGNVIDLSPYATTVEVEGMIDDLADTYATIDYVDQEVAGVTAPVTSVNGLTGDVVLSIPSMNGYATESWVTGQGYLTEAPVASVNGQTGTVVLDAEDVGALPEDTTIPTNVSDLTNDSGFLNATTLAPYLANKQDILTAGNNITISNGVISATDTNTTYTAGTGIDITNNVISATGGTSYTGGNGIAITSEGNIAVRLAKGDSGLAFDSNGYLYATQDSGGTTYTAGYGIEIDDRNNVISNNKAYDMNYLPVDMVDTVGFGIDWANDVNFDNFSDNAETNDGAAYTDAYQTIRVLIYDDENRNYLRTSFELHFEEESTDKEGNTYYKWSDGGDWAFYNTLARTPVQTLAFTDIPFNPAVYITIETKEIVPIPEEYLTEIPVDGTTIQYNSNGQLEAVSSGGGSSSGGVKIIDVPSMNTNQWGNVTELNNMVEAFAAGTLTELPIVALRNTGGGNELWYLQAIGTSGVTVSVSWFNVSSNKLWISTYYPAGHQWVGYDQVQNYFSKTTYTAGSGISISNGVISATGGGGTTYTAGDGIDITNDEISVSVDGTTIGFNSNGQLEAVSSGGSGTSYTAGDNIDITNGVISLDDTVTIEDVSQNSVSITSTGVNLEDENGATIVIGGEYIDISNNGDNTHLQPAWIQVNDCVWTENSIELKDTSTGHKYQLSIANGEIVLTDMDADQ